MPTLSRETCNLYCLMMVLPQIVKGPGKYKTRSGEVVTIDRLGGYNNYQATGLYSNGVPECWFVSGRVLPHYLSPNDIVEPLEN